MVSKIVVANIVSFICIVLDSYANVKVNRKLGVSIWIITHILYAISYMILGTKTLLYTSMYAIFKHSYTLIKYNNKPIIFNKVEAILLNIPYLVLGIVGSRTDGIFGIIFSIATFCNGMGLVFKTDKARYTDYIITNSYKAIYNIIKMNYIAGLNYIISVITQTIGMVKIVKRDG